MTKGHMMRKIKVIMLDIDGVMRSSSSIIRNGAQGDLLHPEHVDALNFILENSPESYIVVTSTYRIAYTVRELKQIFMECGIRSNRIIAKTPELVDSYCRGDEIMAFLKDVERKNQVEITDYVVLDDDTDMNGIDWKNFVKCNGQYGLTFVEALRAVKVLNGKALLPSEVKVYRGM
jgi:hypothetical protein